MPLSYPRWSIYINGALASCLSHRPLDRRGMGIYIIWMHGAWLNLTPLAELNNIANTLSYLMLGVQRAQFVVYISSLDY